MFGQILSIQESEPEHLKAGIISIEKVNFSFLFDEALILES